jgi:hypothetical protein
MRLLLPIFSFWLLLYSCGIQKVDLPEALNEVSGIEQISKDLYVSINDSGDEPYLYVFNSSGEIVHRVYVSGAKNIDWEDITYDGNYLYIGDIGNNRNQRKDIAIYRIDIDTTIKMGYEGNDSGIRLKDTVEALRYSFQYPDQKEYPPQASQMNFDSEALAYDKGNLLILSKDRSKPYKGVCKIYEGEFLEDKLNVKLIQQIKLKGLSWLTGSVTGCDYSNGMLYVLTYKRVYVYKRVNDQFNFLLKKNLGRLQQWEGVCLDSNNLIRVVAEKSRLGKQKLRTINIWE